MIRDFRDSRPGYTIIELMVTVVIVAVLSATVGTLFVKLLTIQETDREEAYFRETLADICGIYADYLSIGSTISNAPTGFVATYRQETGGVSLETGHVVHVTQLTSLNKTAAFNTAVAKSLDLSIFSLESGKQIPKVLSSLRGDAVLIPLLSDQVFCNVTPLNATRMEDATLGYLTVTARYGVKNDEGKLVYRNATAERVVRLWNRK